MPKNDGIDIDRCRDVHISDCHIACGGDAICLKTCRGVPDFEACENITITGCTLTLTSSALKIGNECCAPVCNVIFNAWVIHSSNRVLSIHLGEDGEVESMLFSNLGIETRLFYEDW